MSSVFASLAVIIPTKNRPDDLDITIESVFGQTVLPRRVIVVDQSVADESRSRVMGRYEALAPDVQNSLELVYIRDPSITGGSAARNRGIELANTEFLLFLDDDVLLERDFNERILEVYRQNPEAVGVSGTVTNYIPLPALFRYWARIFMRGPFHDDRQPVYWAANQLRKTNPVRVTRLGGGLMSFPAAAIRTIRFDENLHGVCDGEDVDFCARLWPGPVFIAPSARLMHKQSPKGRSTEHWLPRHARTMWYLYRRNWTHGLHNRLCFIWLNIGYVLVAAVATIRGWSTASYTSLLTAIQDSRHLVRANL